MCKQRFIIYYDKLDGQHLNFESKAVLLLCTIIIIIITIWGFQSYCI